MLAARGHINGGLLAATIIGMALVIGSACVFNNYIDRDIDEQMARTKRRAIASGVVSGRAALIYATALGLIGFALLLWFVNGLTVIIGAIGFIDYVVLYGIGKRRSVHGTLIGSVSGAAPIVAGYTAVADRFDVGAAILFIMLVIWQMPHFFAIAIYRRADYAAAGLPVLPVSRSVAAAKRQILAYVIAFVPAVALLTIFGYAGYAYLVGMLVISIIWVVRGLRGFRTADDSRWARGMFFYSLIVILTLSLLVAVGSVLP